jgi:hypothetical protein
MNVTLLTPCKKFRKDHTECSSPAGCDSVCIGNSMVTFLMDF